MHAVRCLLNFAWGGPGAVERLRRAGAEEAVGVAASRPSEEEDKDCMELGDAARGLLQALGVAAPPPPAAAAAAAAAAPVPDRGHGVFLSHKLSDSQDFCRSIYTMLETRGIKCFLDSEIRNITVNDLAPVVVGPGGCCSTPPR